MGLSLTSYLQRHRGKVVAVGLALIVGTIAVLLQKLGTEEGDDEGGEDKQERG
jgi:hypothetical protein